MPYDIRKTADGYHVYNQATGEDKGKSVSRAKAEAQMRALSASESPRKVVSGELDGGKMQGVPTYLDDTYTRQPVLNAWVDGKSVGIQGAPSAPSAPVEAAAASSPAASGEALPAFKYGGIIGKVKKAAKKVASAPGDAKDYIAGEVNKADNAVFGGQGLGSNLRKLKKELKTGGK